MKVISMKYFFILVLVLIGFRSISQTIIPASAQNNICVDWGDVTLSDISITETASQQFAANSSTANKLVLNISNSDFQFDPTSGLLIASGAVTNALLTVTSTQVTIEFDYGNGIGRFLIQNLRVKAINAVSSATIKTDALSSSASFQTAFFNTANYGNLHSRTVTVSAGLPVSNICRGNSIVLNGSSEPGVTLSWSPSNNMVGANTLTPTITPTSTTSYRLLATDAFGCWASSITTVQVSDPVAIHSQPVASTVCAGGNASFTIGATGSAPSYQWQYSSGVGWTNVGSNSPTLVLPTTQLANAGLYQVIVSNSPASVCTNTVSSNRARLTVNTPTAIVTQPVSNQRVCEGNGANFSVVATGTALSYQWRKNLSNIPGATNTSYSITNTTATDAGNYDVIVTGTCGTVTSNVSVLNVQTAPTVTLSPADVTSCVGSNAVFSSAATGTNITYQWQENGVDLNNGLIYTGVNTPNLTIKGITQAMSGNQYMLKVSGTCAPVATSTSATLTVDSYPLIVTQPIATTVCAGSTGINFSTVATGSGLTYRWQEDRGNGFNDLTDGGNYNQTGTSTLVISTATINMNLWKYRVKITGNCGTAIFTSEETLNIQTSPAVVTNPLDVTDCAGNTVQFMGGATGSGLLYQWQENGVDLNNGSVYTGVNTPDLTIKGITQSLSGRQYRLKITGSCTPVVNTNTATLTVNSVPIIQTQPLSNNICEGGVANFSVTAGNTTNPTYQWEMSNNNGVTFTALPNETAATLSIQAVPLSSTGQVFRVRVGGTCLPPAVSDLASLTVQQRPTILLNPSNTSVCDGGTATFVVSAAGSNLSFQWKEDGRVLTNGGIYAGVGSNTLTLTGITTALNSKRYSVELTSTTGICPTPAISTDAILTVNTLPSASAAGGIICAGQSTNIPITNPNTVAGTSYTWLVQSSTNITGAGSGSGNVINQILHPTDGINTGVVTYRITPHSGANCTGATTDVTVTVNPNPILNSTLVPIPICSGNTFFYTPTSSTVGATFSWTRSAVSGISGLGTNGAGNISETLINTTSLPLTVNYQYESVLNGCRGSVQTVSVLVNPIPILSSVLSPSSSCSGSTFSYVPTSATTGATFTWSRAAVVGVTTAAANGTGNVSEVLINNTSNPLTVTYQYETTANGCTSAPQAVTVVVNPLPTINSVATPTAICSGNQFNYVITSATTGTTFNWTVLSQNGASGATPGMGNTINQVLQATGSSPGNITYSIVATSGGCSGAASQVVVTINPLPNVLLSPAAKTICSGENTAIAITNPNGVLGTIFNWEVSQNGVNGTSAGTGSVISQNLSTLTSTPGTATYTVTPTAGNCVGNPANVVVTVNPLPNVVANPSTQSICSGTTTGISLSTSNGVTGTNYNWTVVQNSTSGAFVGSGNAIHQSLLATTTTIGTTTYSITPVANGCSGAVVPVTISVKPTPVGRNDIREVCSASSLNYDLQSNINQLGNANPAIRFTWIAANNVNVTGESITNSTTTRINDVLLNTTSIDQTVIYTITPTAATNVGACVGNSFLVSVTVKPEPVGQNDTQLICSNVPANYNLINNISMRGNNVGSTYSWIGLPNTAVTGYSATSQTGGIITDVLVNKSGVNQLMVYDVTPTSTNGCVGNIFKITIEVKPEPVGTSVTAATICSGMSVNYSLQNNINLSNSLTSTFTWIASANPLVTGASTLARQTPTTISDVLTNTTLVPQTIDYSVQPTGSNGCIGSMFNIQVVVNPQANINAGPDISICSNIPSASLQGLVNYAPNGVVWSGGMGAYSNHLSPTSTYAFSNPTEINQTLTLTLTANDPDGAGPCLAISDQMNLTINPLPVVVFSGLTSTLSQTAPPLTLIGNQIGGLFSISPATSTIGSTIQNPVDKVTLNPNAVTLGLNTITYTYTNSSGCSNSYSQTFVLNPATRVDFSIQYQTGTTPFPFVPINANGEFELCANVGMVKLVGNPTVSTGIAPTNFSAVGLNGTVLQAKMSQMGNDFFIDTNGLPPDTYTIQYIYTNSLNVTTPAFSRRLILFASPTAVISNAANNCISNTVNFTDASTIAAPYAISSWRWDLVEGGIQNVQSPSYKYINQGNYLISLTVSTAQGCSNTTTMNIRVGGVPVAGFDWASICSNDFTKFQDRTTNVVGANPPGISSIITYSWDFGDGDNLTDVPAVGTIPANHHSGRTKGSYQNPEHNYSTQGTYRVVQTVKTNDGCINTFSQDIFILISGNLVTPNLASPYIESFEGSNFGGWISEGLRISALGTRPIVNSLNSWLCETPSGSTIKNASDGSKAWWTGSKVKADIANNLLNPTYYIDEASAVNGPCFNLSQLNRPMVSLDYWSDSERGLDGAVLQYSIDGGVSWQLVGQMPGDTKFDQGINWYNEKSLPSNPGQQPSGNFAAWTDKQGEWKNAKFNLDMIDPLKRDKVRMRIAFGSNNTNEQTKIYDGFAFDNFFVGEKTRTVLVEHFTNSTIAQSLTADTYINNLFADQINLIRPNGTSDFNDIQYHISNSSSTSDGVNRGSEKDPNSRASNYAVSQPPRTYVDGLKTIVFDGDFNKIDKYEIDRRSLVDPLFMLNLDTIPTGNAHTINVSMKMKALKDVKIPLIAQVALVEDNVTTPTGVFKNVLRKLLWGSDATKPDGITITQAFTAGQSAEFSAPTKIVEINTPIQNSNNLKLIGFIQDKNNGEIYQSVVLKASPKINSPITGIEPHTKTIRLQDFQLYPNPASNVVNVIIPTGLGKLYQWEIINQQGIVMLKGDFKEGKTDVNQLNISSLLNGVYLLRIGNGANPMAVKKLIVLNQN